jgi:hypothetical protein
MKAASFKNLIFFPSMNITRIFGALLVFSTLASAIAGGGFSLPQREKESEQDLRDKQQEQQELWQRSRTENDSNDVPLFQRGDRVEAADPTIVRNEDKTSKDSLGNTPLTSQEEEFYKRRALILKIQKKYQDRDAIFYANQALAALEQGFKAASSKVDDSEIASLVEQQAGVYNSIVCDYMDAAEARHQSSVTGSVKVPKPYLDAINAQVRMLDFLNELQTLNERGVVSEEQRSKLQNQVQQAREVAKKLRTRPGHANILEPTYAGLRFFPEIPH